MSLHPKTPPTRAAVQSTVSDTSKPRRRLRLRWKIFGVIVLLLVVIPIVLYVTAPKYYTVLLIGSDQRTNEHARSDVLLLLTIPKNAGDRMSMVMIPRDTKIDDTEHGIQKITHYYAMWDEAVNGETVERLGNRALTQQHVEQLLDIHVNATIEITFDSFVEIVDGVGGVDTLSGHLTGSEAMELVHNRFNKPNGDFGRGEVERDVVKAIVEKAKNITTARWLYSYLTTASRARLTYSQSQFVQFALAYSIGHRGKIMPDTTPQETVLPGVGEKIYTPEFGKELYYWVLDPVQTKTIVDTYLR